MNELRWLSHARLWLALSLTALLFAPGCGRAFYRKQADRQSYQLLDCAGSDPRWALESYSIDPDPRSRMYDPNNPDFPPMPPDDPTSHKLMHCVDCMRGYCCWHKNGDTPYVANPNWKSYLPLSPDGALVLDLRGAVEMGYLQARDYQTELEDLYLSALDVTFERFRFETQFYGGSSLFFTADGPNRPGGGGESSSQLNLGTLTPGNRLRAEKMFAAGGELVVGLANSIVWEFSGEGTQATTSLLDFNFVQPLLRFAGRARVLERLTLSERTLLANARQMERYRQGFYVELVTGRSAGPGPSRRGGFFGGSGLEGFSGVGGGGFGRVGTANATAGAAGTTGGAGAAEAGGYMGLLQDQQKILNQTANVAALRDSVAQLQAAHEAGRIDRFQVDLARQALYNAQSQLITSKARLQSVMDNFKVRLGLPPDIDLRLDDPLLERFKLIDPQLANIQYDVDLLLDGARGTEQGPGLAIGQMPDQVAKLREVVARHAEVVEADFARLQQVLPERREALARMAKRDEVQTKDLELDLFSVSALDNRFTALQLELGQLVAKLDVTLHTLADLPSPESDTEQDLRPWIAALTDLSSELLELSLIQARIRLDSIVMLPIDMQPTEALRIASHNRLDWMNARASLVDSWRLIEFNANTLKSGLDIVFSGDVGNRGNNPVNFNSTTGRLRVGVEFDAPLTRLAERNIYRQSLIEYEQARRNYYLFVDRVEQGLRDILRTIALDELNFELRRAAVLVGISQVDLARLKLSRPPQPGETSELNNTTARDLVTALSDLLNVQNDFLSVWVNYEVQRLSLDWDLGTMRLDDHGLWIDPGQNIGRVACDNELSDDSEDVKPAAPSRQQRPPRPPQRGIQPNPRPAPRPSGKAAPGSADDAIEPTVQELPPGETAPNALDAVRNLKRDLETDETDEVDSTDPP